MASGCGGTMRRCGLRGRSAIGPRTALAEWETLRELASRIKLHTMSRLDEYLEQFEANATRLGAEVHWARDAAEHNAIVGDILQRHGATQRREKQVDAHRGMRPQSVS